jgi:hypothetical protein
MNRNNLSLFLLTSLVFPAHSMYFLNQSLQPGDIIDKYGDNSQPGLVPDVSARVVPIVKRLIEIVNMPEQEFFDKFGNIQWEIAAMNLTGIVEHVLDALVKALGSVDEARKGIVGNTYDILDLPEARAALKPLIIALVNRYKNEPSADPIIVGNLEHRIAW